MSNVFIVDLFYFQINQNITIFAASNQNFTDMPEYIKHMILNNLQVFYIYSKKHLHHFSIFCNMSIFSFISCVSVNALPKKRFHIYFQVCINDLLSKQSDRSCIRVSMVSEWSKAGREGVRKGGRERGSERGSEGARKVGREEGR